MRVRIAIEPQQGATYDHLLTIAREVEHCGFDALFRSDHYMSIGGRDGRPGSTDAWTTLAGLARETSRIRLGTLVTSATFRLPGPLAIAVAQVDAMSGGRVELGLGAGWFEDEHRAYGIPFPPTAERFDRLEEQFEILTGLWGTAVGDRFSYRGRYYSITDSPALPKPTQSPHPPLIVGGTGRTRTPRLAARFADEFNVPSHGGVDDTAAEYDRVRRACEAAGRDPKAVDLSVAVTVCCGSDQAEVGRRAAVIDQNAAELRARGATGTPAEVAERLLAYRAIGATTVYLQVFDLQDLDHLRLLAAEVLPALAAA